MDNIKNDFYRLTKEQQEQEILNLKISKFRTDDLIITNKKLKK